MQRWDCFSPDWPVAVLRSSFISSFEANRIMNGTSAVAQREDYPTSRKGNFLRRFITDGGIIVALLVLFELFVRSFVPFASKLLYTRQLTGGHPVAVNGDGLRE